VLAAYRDYGVGTHLMKEVLASAAAAGAAPGAAPFDEVFLHVWVGNEGAMRFYSRLGFVAGERISNYYRRIEPPDAIVMRLALPAAAR
jgi:ribosomal protein S18 acetylase RimI-like enzyme